MKNKDRYLIDESETNSDSSPDNGPSASERFEEIVINLVTSFGFILALVLISINVNASERPDNEILLSEVSRGSLLYKSDNNDNYRLGLMLDTRVEMKVSGMIVRTKVSQSFKNDTNEWLEGLYVFPLPDAAAIDRMKIKIGQRTIESQVQEKKHARKRYRQARQNGVKAALIEQQRANLFTNAIANIAPGETVTVEIEYQQILKFVNEQFSIRFPTTVTKRYTPRAAQAQQGLTQDWSSESSLAQGDSKKIATTENLVDANYVTTAAPHTGPNMSIHIELNAGFPVSEITSRYHKIESIHHIQGHYTISLLDEVIVADHDFVVSWTPELGSLPQAAIFNEVTEIDNYYLVMVLPPRPDISENELIARDVTYIIDTSGSMHGSSMLQAKAALKFALTRLRDIDKFNIIEFNSTANTLFEHSRVAHSNNIERAEQFLQNLTAAGGTEMKVALQTAFDNHSSPGFIRQIIFLTDGSVSNEAELFQIIKQRLNNSRLFTVAIGSAPNSYFMNKAAKFGRGSYTYIAKVAEVQKKMNELFTKIEKPVLQDLKVIWPSSMSTETWPARLPDLYSGEPVLFTTRVTSQSNDLQPANLTITGTRSSQDWQQTLALTDATVDQGIGILWASNKIVSLMDQIHEYRYSGTDTGRTSDIVATIKQKIINLAMTFHLISAYTSLVAIDTSPSRPLLRGLNKVAVQNISPRGSQQSFIAGQYAQTASGWQLHLMIGIGLLLLILFLVLPTRKKHRYFKNF